MQREFVHIHTSILPYLYERVNVIQNSSLLFVKICDSCNMYVCLYYYCIFVIAYIIIYTGAYFFDLLLLGVRVVSQRMHL